MTPTKGTTHAQFLEELQRDPEFRKQQRLIRPFYRISAEIIQLRNQLGLTQKELAKRAGTHQTRISKIESSELDIRLSTLTDLAEALDCQVVINFVPIAGTSYLINDDPYRWLFGSQIKVSGITSFVVDSAGGYQAGPVMEGTYGQCN
jgi:transcriptional regulator with XRE-family HTH domain